VGEAASPGSGRPSSRQLVIFDVEGEDMATFTVWQFDTDQGAESALSVLQRLQTEELIQVQDAAVVSWPDGAKKPKTKQLHNLVSARALGGGFWGFLFGLIFFVPLLGLAVGAATGALSGSLGDVGIDDAFIKDVRTKVKPGTSALFLLTSGAVIDKVAEEFEAVRDHATLMHTNLSNAQEAKLREAFVEDVPAAV
jgi:uncharacterized membrane protein